MTLFTEPSKSWEWLLLKTASKAPVGVGCSRGGLSWLRKVAKHQPNFRTQTPLEPQTRCARNTHSKLNSFTKIIYALFTISPDSSVFWLPDALKLTFKTPKIKADFVPTPGAFEKAGHLESVRQRDLCSLSLPC